MAITCPGYNPNVLPQPEKGHGLGDGTKQDDADKEARANAEKEALSKAWLQFPKNMCPPPCITIPILHIVDSGAVPVPAAAGATHFASIGWANAQLDVLCVSPPPAAPAPPAEESIIRKIAEELFRQAWDKARDDFLHRRE
jgi:hypothetical protein